jgi:tripartite-type tricarboxylate transporter receptor subunit TctC
MVWQTHVSRRRAIALAGGAVLAPLVRPAPAQAYPTRPITLVVSFPAGGTTDRHFRLLAELASHSLGQAVQVENRPGGGGTLGTVQVGTQSAPDGYTLANFAVGMLRLPFMGKVAWRPIEDFTFIRGLSDYTFGLLVKSDSPLQSLDDFIDAARRRPGQVSYASGGVGGSPHLLMEMLAAAAGVKLLHVPFRGGPDMQQALLGGHVTAACDASGFERFVEAGSERLLATFRAERSPRWPKVPTARERGYDVVMTAPYGLVGPHGMDTAVVEVLNDAFRAAVRHPRNLALMEQFGQEPFELEGAAYQAWAEAQLRHEKKTIDQLKRSSPATFG